MISDQDKMLIEQIVPLNEYIVPDYSPSLPTMERVDSMAQTMYEKAKERDSLIIQMKEQIEDLSRVVNVLWKEVSKEKAVKRKFPGDGR